MKKLAMQEEKEKQRQAKLEEREKKIAAMKEEKEKKAAALLETKEAKVPSVPKKKVEEAAKKKDNFNVFNRLMAESISTLVDERVRALIPYIKKEVNEEGVENLEDIEEKLVHENYNCKICTVNPIIGIRYECPKCEGFSICERCETLYDHEHNLMKIKKLENKAPGKKVQPAIKKLYDIFFA
jgi:transcriptional regulator